MNASIAGKLIIVPTPIGNLGDMTLRSLEALRAADTVCAEDTRVTGKLLAHFDIRKPLERLDEAMIGAKAASVMERVAAGEGLSFELEERPVERNIYMAWRTKGELTPAAKEFSAFVRKSVKEA